MLNPEQQIGVIQEYDNGVLYLYRHKRDDTFRTVKINHQFDFENNVYVKHTQPSREVIEQYQSGADIVGVSRFCPVNKFTTNKHRHTMDTVQFTYELVPVAQKTLKTITLEQLPRVFYVRMSSHAPAWLVTGKTSVPEPGLYFAGGWKVIAHIRCAGAEWSNNPFPGPNEVAKWHKFEVEYTE